MEILIKALRKLIGIGIILFGIFFVIGGIGLSIDSYERQFNFDSIIFAFVVGFIFILIGKKIQNTKKYINKENSKQNIFNNDIKENIKIENGVNNIKIEETFEEKKYQDTNNDYFHRENVFNSGNDTMNFFQSGIRIWECKNHNIYFATDSIGKLYMFDTNSKAFKNRRKKEMQKSLETIGLKAEDEILFKVASKIANNKYEKVNGTKSQKNLIKELIDKREIYQCGKGISRVKDIVEKREFYIVNCILSNEIGDEKTKRITVMKNYENIETLIKEFKKLKI